MGTQNKRPAGSHHRNSRRLLREQPRHIIALEYTSKDYRTGIRADASRTMAFRPRSLTTVTVPELAFPFTQLRVQRIPVADAIAEVADRLFKLV